RTTEDLSQEIHPDLQEAPKAPTTNWWDVNGEGSESSNVCLEDRINEIYNFYFDNVEKVVLEIDIGELEETDRDQFRTMTAAEQNYSVIEQECLAVIWSISYFRQYLHGSHFTLITDHSALKFLLSHKLPQGQLARWILALQEYTFIIVHHSRRQHSNADSLSRISEPTSLLNLFYF
ncbi:18751_t:CDS:2, partial [Racocetra persica]